MGHTLQATDDEGPPADGKVDVVYLTLFLISAASLAFQVALTRFFSLAQGSHLAFMAISLALLGIGASGTYLSLKQLPAAGLRRVITTASALFALSIPAAYLVINYLPFDAYRLAWERVQILWLALYYLALAVPFFFSGLVIGAALAAQPERAGPTYAANLLGSGLGPPLALLALATLGGPGTVFLCALLGWLAAAGSYRSIRGRQWFERLFRRRQSGPRQVFRFNKHDALPLTLYPAVAILLGYLSLYPPAPFDVRLTPYKSLSQALLYPDSQVVFSRWNAFSRVDVLRSQSIRSAPGLSFAFTGTLPRQLGLTVDGDNLVPITRPSEPALTQYLPLALAFELRPAATVLILEPGGGLAVLTALQNGAAAVTVVQSNHSVAEAVGHRFSEFNDHLYGDPRVNILIDEPRSFLRRTEQQFDLIILPLTDSFRPVTAGAYTLNEDYRYTVEAFADSLAHLSPNGLLVVERWLQLPPSESLRLWGTLLEALRRWSSSTGQDCSLAYCGRWLGMRLLAMRSLQTSLIIAGLDPLSTPDLAIARKFATGRQYDLIWRPSIQPDETNRFSVVPGDPYHSTFAELLTTSQPDAFFADYPLAVAPATDNYPFFFHFFKWGQIPEIMQSFGKTWQPFGGSGYLVLVGLLALVAVLSAALILLPLFVAIGMGQSSQSRSSPAAVAAPKDEAPSPPDSGTPAPLLARAVSQKALLSRYLLYFTLLGLGFLFVEIPLLQRFILYLGQPSYSFAVVVSAVLVAAGLGSNFLSNRLPLRFVLPLIAVMTVSYPLLLDPLFNATLRLPLAGRVAVTVLALFPLGMLLGIPFPRGLVWVGQTAPALTPWVWAVNGCASVVSAVLAAMIALTWGFAVVLWTAALAYGLAALVFDESQQPIRSA